MGSFKRSASNNSLSASARDDIKYEVSDNLAFTVVVLGASGDLAKKKTFPALFTLFDKGYVCFDFKCPFQSFKVILLRPEASCKLAAIVWPAEPFSAFHGLLQVLERGPHAADLLHVDRVTVIRTQLGCACRSRAQSLPKLAAGL